MTMKISDDMIAAYVDGELTGEEAAQVRRAEAEDSAVRDAVQRYRTLRAEIDSSFRLVMNAPPPRRFTNMLNTVSSESAPSSRRLDRPGWRKSRRFVALTGGAVAASLAIGFSLGVLSPSSEDGDGLQLAADQTLSAGTFVAQLENDPSAKAGDRFHIAATYITADGGVCRRFFLGEDERLQGVACRRSANDWRITALAPAPPADAYVTAGAMQGAFSDILSEYRKISQAEEERLIESQWQGNGEAW